MMILFKWSAALNTQQMAKTSLSTEANFSLITCSVWLYLLKCPYVLNLLVTSNVERTLGVFLTMGLLKGVGSGNSGISLSEKL